MSDNLRRYRAIRAALTQGYPGKPQGHVARHLTTLAALISGIVGSKRTQLPHIATHVPDGTKAESRVKRFARWVDNEHILEEAYFLPYADCLLRHLALQGIRVKRDTQLSIAYSEELISSTISATLQSTDRHHGIVGQERCHFQRDS